MSVVVSAFDPLVQEWFERLGVPTEPQLRGWPVIRAGEDVLDLRSHGLRENAGGFSDLHRQPDPARTHR